jgi:hypothetical protein
MHTFSDDIVKLQQYNFLSKLDNLPPRRSFVFVHIIPFAFYTTTAMSKSEDLWSKYIVITYA